MSRLPCLGLMVILVGSVGCDRVLGFERDRPCGDGDLALTEDCDDGGNTAGDGCSVSCQVEPGFVCPFENAGQPCLPVLGLARGPVVTTLDPAGDGGGTAFSFECPAGAVVIGFDGYLDEAGDNLGRINIVCGALGVGTAGVALVSRASESGFLGGTPSGSMLTALCAADEVATGFVPSTNNYVSRFEWTCQKLSHTEGALRFGASRSVSFGQPAGTEEAARTCPPTQAVTQVFGDRGASIGLLGMGCSEISAVVCGDGVVAKPEACDDGNLIPHDGCNERCQRE